MMTEREQKVMDLHDRGFRNGEIALLLDIKPAAVTTITKRYGLGDSGFANGIIQGSRDLRIAIERDYPAKKQGLGA